MAGLSEDCRAKAKAYLDSADKLIEGFEPATRNVVAAIVGQVKSDILSALADVLDYQAAQRAAIRQELLREKTKEFADKQNDIRTTAAVGTEDEFNRAINNKPAPVASGT